MNDGGCWLVSGEDGDESGGCRRALREQTGLSRLADLFPSLIFLVAAAVLCRYGDLPLGAVFFGWIAYFTRGVTLRDRIYNIACAITGLGFGIVALSLELRLNPDLGIMALPVTLLLVAVCIQLMQWTTGVNNIPAYFLGVLAAFVPAAETSLDSYLLLTVSISAGAFAAALPDILRPKPKVSRDPGNF